jgi:lysophospholipase L1-like esterase
MLTPRYFALGLFSALVFASFPVRAADSAPTPIPYRGMSLDDTAKLNAALNKAMVAEDASIKAILDANPSFSIVKGNSAIIPTPYVPARHDGFVAIAKKGDIDVLFDGDSITDFWATNGKDVFPKYFGGLKLANFAISGDTTQGVLYRLQNGEGQGFQPKAIMLMIGTNNVSRGNTAVEVTDGIIADLNELRKDFPDAKILLLAVFPRGLPSDPYRKTIADINAMIAKLDDQQHIFYLDIGSKFLGEDGVFLPDTFLPDNLHPKAAGYEIWANAVKDKLAELMK